MADRFDICIPRPGKDGKTRWHRIGSAFPRDNGAFALDFDSLPVPEYSQEYGLQVRAMLFPAKPKDSGDEGGAPF